MPTLTSAKITFQTGDDDKHKESSLDIFVRDNSGQIIAKAVAPAPYRATASILPQTQGGR